MKSDLTQSLKAQRYLLTLKGAGFLVSQICGGGLIQSILGKRTVTPPNFILEQQTESHMKA